MIVEGRYWITDVQYSKPLMIGIHGMHIICLSVLHMPLKSLLIKLAMKTYPYYEPQFYYILVYSNPLPTVRVIFLKNITVGKNKGLQEIGV
jgi:hypothetical protein